MPIIAQSTYQVPRLFRHYHINTLYPALLRPTKGIDFQRVRQELPDGDFIDLDWCFQQKKPHTHQLVVCLHGLEGNARRPYMAHIMRRFNLEGYDAVGINFRGCSGENNRFLRGYHSGWTHDLDFLINQWDKQGHYTEIVIVGFSVGGNITLKYGGEKGSAIPPSVKKLIAFSAPCDLATCSREIARPHNAFYQWQFLYTLKQKAREKNQLFPNQFDLDKVLIAKTFGGFDDHFTAPINGYRDAEDYWANASSLPHLHNIRVPALLVNAKDDSFLSAECFPFEIAQQHAFLHLEIPKHGGHLGFMKPDKAGFLWSEHRAWAFASENVRC
jgi:uncharacterized protein